MKYKDFKQTDEYMGADAVEVFDHETGFEYDDDYPENELENFEVVEFSQRSGFLSVTLKKEEM